MSSTPIFDLIGRQKNYKIPLTEYVDRYTPEMARQQGVLTGGEDMKRMILALARDVKKPTKQLLDLIEKIEAIDYE
jgi:hypothetical protein